MKLWGKTEMLFSNYFQVQFSKSAFILESGNCQNQKNKNGNMPFYYSKNKALRYFLFIFRSSFLNQSLSQKTEIVRIRRIKIAICHSNILKAYEALRVFLIIFRSSFLNQTLIPVILVKEKIIVHISNCSPFRM